MRKASFLGLLVAVLLGLFPTGLVFAEAPPGLSISPVRDSLTMRPGKSVGAVMEVYNQTDRAATISLSMQQFSVADYTYDYIFEVPKENWVSFEKNTD